LVGCLVVWLVGWLVGCLVVWLFGCLVRARVCASYHVIVASNYVHKQGIT
jgi:hypothetical protein